MARSAAMNFTSDPSVLFAAWESVLGIVDGHCLNVPHGRRPGDGGGVPAEGGSRRVITVLRLVDTIVSTG
jgi:hypothetical protein